MKATRSKDGAMRVTVRVEVRVRAEVFEWLRERVGAIRAEAGIGAAVREHGLNSLEWQMVGLAGGDVVTVHVDDVAAGNVPDGFVACPERWF